MIQHSEILISVRDGTEFEASLACQSMSIEAISIGYGVKIIGSPVSIINENCKSELRVYEESNVIVLIVGIADSFPSCSTESYAAGISS